MADIRCPMCGKMNPDDREICQYCQARLKPLRMNPAETGGEPEAGDWSRPSTPQGSDEELPEWLTSLRSSEAAPEASEDPQPFDFGPSEDAETFDPAAWLAGLRARPSDASETGKSGWEAAAGPASSDWLNSLRGGAADEAGETAPEGDEGATMGGDLPDWLAGPGSFEAEAGEEDLTPAPAQPTQMPWELPEAEEPRAAQPEETYDWLASFDREQPAAAAQPAEEIPDWFQDPAADAAQPSAEATPAWLSDLTNQGAAEAEELPDWLAQESGPEAASGAQSYDFEVEEPAGSTETPASALAFDTTEANEAAWNLEPGGAAKADETDVPDWMSGLWAAGAATGAEAAAAVPAASEDEAKASEPPVSDWESFLAGTQAEAGEPALETPAAAEDDLDWLNELGAGQSAAFEAASANPTGAVVSPFAFDDTEDEAELEPLYDSQVPDWLADISSQAAEPAEGTQASSSRPALTPGSREGESGLERSDLPSWLEAIRPVEAAIPETPAFVDGEDQMIGIGPLAGLRGVLPAEPDITRIKKPGSYSVKLQVSDAQARHASLLEELIQTEANARPIPARARITPQHVLRALVGMVLILVVVWPLLTGTPAVRLPDPIPAGGAVSETIRALSGDAPVLVAFDYDPGFAGEMDATASTVLDHLMTQGAHLTLVSTTPNGPVQAERVVAAVNLRGGHTYDPELQYSNLGFVPGGATGLASFAADPRGVMPLVLGGASPWSRPQLAGVQSLADFQLVVVLTEDPDRARAWIEQVEPSLDDTPLVMAVSAQAEPLIRPYLDGSPQQVRGLVSGVAGGAAYETATGRPGLASSYWTAFSLVTWAAVLMIVLGALLNAGASLFSRNRAETERDDAV